METEHHHPCVLFPRGPEEARTRGDRLPAARGRQLLEMSAPPARLRRLRCPSATARPDAHVRVRTAGRRRRLSSRGSGSGKRAVAGAV